MHSRKEIPGTPTHLGLPTVCTLLYRNPDTSIIFTMPPRPTLARVTGDFLWTTEIVLQSPALESSTVPGPFYLLRKQLARRMRQQSSTRSLSVTWLQSCYRVYLYLPDPMIFYLNLLGKSFQHLSQQHNTILNDNNLTRSFLNLRDFIFEAIEFVFEGTDEVMCFYRFLEPVKFGLC